MEPMTMAMLAGGGATLGGVFDTINSNKQAKQQNKANRQAMQYLMQNMDRDYSTLYGGSANAKGMSTGNPAQDALMAKLTQQTQAKELQALAINNAKQNLTDDEARQRAILQASMVNKSANDAALGAASRQSRRYNQSGGDLVAQASKQRANQNQNIRNNAAGLANSNLADIAAGANLNTGSIADMNRQQVAGLYNMANQNYNNGISQVASLMANKQPTQSALLNGLSSGLTGGISGYGQQKSINNSQANFEKLLAAMKG